MEARIWQGFIHEREIEKAQTPYDLRYLFNKTFMHIENPDVHNLFFERIHFLKKNCVDAEMFESLVDLQDDIEIELEHGAMRSRLNPRNTRRGRPPLEVNESLISLDTNESLNPPEASEKLNSHMMVFH